MKKGERLMYSSVETSGNIAQLESSNVSEKLGLYYSVRNNKEKYNTFLKEQRQKRYQTIHLFNANIFYRIDLPKERERNQKFDLTNEKLEELLPNKEFWVARDKDENKQVLHPFDYDFIFGTRTIPMDQPKYALPDPHDPLFVTKPLGRYVTYPVLQKLTNV